MYLETSSIPMLAGRGEPLSDRTDPYPAEPARTAFRYARLKFRERCVLDAADGSLHLVHCSERSAMLEIPNGWLSVSLPITGLLHASSRSILWQIGHRRMLVWDGALQLRGGNGSGWISLCGSPLAWRRAGAEWVDELFPDEGPCAGSVLRLLVRLVRVVRKGPQQEEGIQDLLADLCAALHEQQSRLRELLPRCSGRTRQNRRRTLLRLLRVQHTIRTRPEQNLDMASLSRQVNYSTWHLGRIYREVFGETPSEYALRLRLERALHLVLRTSLPFCEITEASGFESQSSFCRAFRRQYRTTPTKARAAPPGACIAPSGTAPSGSPHPGMS